MTFDEYENDAKSTAIYNSDIWLEYLSIGLGNEAGEVLGKVKKLLRKDSELTLEYAEKIFDEISDVLWYASNLCNELGNRVDSKFNYENCHKHNINKLFDRKKRGVIAGDGDTR